MDIRVRTDFRPATEGYKQVRRNANRALKDGVVAAGEKAVLPTAKRYAPKRTGKLAASLVVRKGTGNRAYLTSGARLREARIAGLHEFGGTINKRIEPRRKWSKGTKRTRRSALLINGRFVSQVTKPRHYRAQLYMTRARDARRDEFADALVPSILATFREAGFEVSR